ncbi:aspartate dehydrogenase [Cupriavidus consociatus]|uniref:aspartate dehydrogenase n=1 Tax=Cupriavidus consociatus TaxID=2821357 RepID=UPI001AE70E0F|nr:MULTISPECIES: aspartate dehydrogenase [unclassified Cupriavidus]MBP0625055.1 aspartate dehydrogenase [Cupriavidus sp. LEh25]MDK2661789.1 aspartate dehydrogenase [Cupriavidus sp. LEh21]
MNNSIISRIGLLGLGAIGKRVYEALSTRYLPNARFAAIDPHGHASDFVRTHQIQLCSDTEDLARWKPDLVIECAGHDAVATSVPVLLKNGISVVIASIGALAEQPLRQHLEAAAETGAAKLILVSGAIGGLDALRSARTAGLDSVVYVGRKPPRAWLGSPAEERFDLEAIKEATTIFRGTAAEASVKFPKNANVTAAVALSGLGFDATQVELIADPAVDRNVHEVEAAGPFGSINVRLANNPLPDNPRTSWLAALSIEEAVSKQLLNVIF